MAFNGQNTQKLGVFLLVGLGLLFAIFSGNYVADEDYLPVVVVLGLLAVSALFFGIGGSIYLLIPICWGLKGQIGVLPLPFTVRQLVILAASLFFITGLIFKREQRKMTYEPIDLLLYINLLYLILVFVRNPVGVAALGGSERVGGKPYIDVFLGLMAYLMISRQIITPKFSRDMPKIILGLTIGVGFVAGVGFYFPSIATKLVPIYTGFGSGVDTLFAEFREVTAGETRLNFMLDPGIQTILFCVSFVNPMTLLSVGNLPWLILYLFGFLAILLSGFRNAIFSSFLATFLGVFFRERFAGIVKLGFITFAFATMAVLLSYTSVQLPFTFSRALSFLPGNWDVEAVSNAQASTEWRQKMWEIVLTSDQYIKDKVWGDGFGFLRSDYERLASSYFGLQGGDEGLEAFMINGDFHSGPVSAIRFVGMIGLLLFLPLLFGVAFYAYRTVSLCYGTPYQACALFFSIPTMIMPLIFLFVFGDYRLDLVAVMFNLSISKMLRASVVAENAAQQYLLASSGPVS